MGEKVAITSWNEIVSPLYDASCNLMIVQQGGVERVLAIRGMSLFDKANLCKREAVDVLICGAISNDAYAILADRGIVVIPWKCGSISMVLGAFWNNEPMDKFSMPGCRCRLRRRRGGGSRK